MKRELTGMCRSCESAPCSCSQLASTVFSAIICECHLVSPLRVILTCLSFRSPTVADIHYVRYASTTHSRSVPLRSLTKISPWFDSPHLNPTRSGFSQLSSRACQVKLHAVALITVQVDLVDESARNFPAPQEHVTSIGFGPGYFSWAAPSHSCNGPRKTFQLEINEELIFKPSVLNLIIGRNLGYSPLPSINNVS
jgi:hypothetical protein